MNRNFVAKFFYKGNHSHPVRRTVLVTKETKTLLEGYEIREGNEVRPLEDSKFKSYRKDKIAKLYQTKRKNSKNVNNYYVETNKGSSTLRVVDFESLVKEGV